MDLLLEALQAFLRRLAPDAGDRGDRRAVVAAALPTKPAEGGTPFPTFDLLGADGLSIPAAEGGSDREEDMQ